MSNYSQLNSLPSATRIIIIIIIIITVLFL